jgi:hypothetical protein
MNASSATSARPLQSSRRVLYFCVGVSVLQPLVGLRLTRPQVPQRVSMRKQVGLFGHLQQYDRAVALTKAIPCVSSLPISCIMRPCACVRACVCVCVFLTPLSIFQKESPLSPCPH